MSPLDSVFQEITDVTAQIRHCMEQAEAKVEDVNRLVPQLIGSGLLTRSVWLGPSYERDLDRRAGPLDKGEIIRAALLLPEGFGICVWESDDYANQCNSTEGLEGEARAYFQPFRDCSPAEKAFLNASIQSLMEELADVARVAQSRLDDDANMTMEEFFAAEEVDGQRED